ncbi:hypothetical protein [Streptomyces canus]|uniref:hypothetical protein n=1 Tax=Streptomyces canus TaxID=58343 RepID=UPI00381CCA6F
MNHVQEAPGTPESPDGPDRDHRRLPGADDKTVEALGALFKAWDTSERARDSRYEFPQLTAGAGLELDRAVRLLREAGHRARAGKVRSAIPGRSVIPGHGTFQIVEACDATRYRPFQQLEPSAVAELAQGRDHLQEAQMVEEERRTPDRPGHAACPPGPQT